MHSARPEAFEPAQATNSALLETVLDGIFRVGRDGTLLEFRGSRTFVPYAPPSDFLGKKVTEVLPAEVAGPILECVERAVASGGVQTHAYSLPYTGGRRFFETYIFAAGDGSAVCFVRDVTSSVRDKEALREAEELNRAVLESLTDAVAVIGRNGVIVQANQAWDAWARQASGPEFAVPGANFRDVPERGWAMPSARVGVALDGIRSVLEGESTFFELEYEAAAPARRWYLMKVTPLRGSRGGVVVSHSDITSQRAAREELHAANQALQALFQGAPVAILALNREGNLTVWNPAAERMYGYSESEVLGHPPPIVPETKREVFRKAVELVMTGKMLKNIETICQTKSGSFLNTSFSAAPLYDRNGAIIGAMGAIEDITERHKLVQELARGEEQYRLLFEKNPNPMWLFDDDTWQFLAVNQAAIARYGYSRDEFLQMNLRDIRPPEDIPLLLDHLRTNLENGRAIESIGVWRHLKKDGSLILVEVTRSRIRFNGRLAWMAMLQDVTERRRLEQALRESEERFSLFMRHLPAIVVMKNTSGEFVYVNRAGETLSHTPAQEWIGRTVDNFLPPEVTAPLKAADRRVIETGESFETVEVIPRPDGVHHYQAIRFPIRDIDGRVILVGTVTLDITERKRAEESVERGREELRALAASLMTAQEDERRRISRDLHDDLTQRLALLSFDVGSLIAKLPRSSDQIKEQLRILQGRVVEASEGVRHIAYQLHPSILDDLGLEVALRSLCEEFGQREAVPVRYATGGEATAIPQQVASCLYRVAQEGLRNVSKHARAAEVSVTLRCNPGLVRLSILDTGAGFNPDAAAGQGLGFISMKERVRLVGGCLAIDSQPGAGTRITVSVPLPEEK